MNSVVSIPKPCDEDWSKMTPNDNGKYCDKCKLTVVDFTSMSDEQIQQYLLNRQYVCGRFNESQLYTFKKDTWISSIANKRSSIPLRYFVLFFLLLSIVLSSCLTFSFDERKRKLMGAVAYPGYRNDSIKFK